MLVLVVNRSSVLVRMSSMAIIFGPEFELNFCHMKTKFSEREKLIVLYTHFRKKGSDGDMTTTGITREFLSFFCFTAEKKMHHIITSHLSDCLSRDRKSMRRQLGRIVHMYDWPVNLASSWWWGTELSKKQDWRTLQSISASEYFSNELAAKTIFRKNQLFVAKRLFTLGHVTKFCYMMIQGNLCFELAAKTIFCKK